VPTTPAVVINLHEERPNSVAMPVVHPPVAPPEKLGVHLSLNPFNHAIISNHVASIASLDSVLGRPADYVTLVQSSAGTETHPSGSAPLPPKRPEPPPPGRGPSPDSPASSGGTAGGIASAWSGGVMAALVIALFAFAAPGLSSRVATLLATPLGVPRRLSLERPG